MANIAQKPETIVAQEKDWSVSQEQIFEGLKRLFVDRTYCEDYYPHSWFLDLEKGSCGVFLTFDDWDVRDAYGRLTKEEWPSQANRKFTQVEIHGMFHEAHEYIKYDVRNWNNEEVVMTIYPQKELS